MVMTLDPDTEAKLRERNPGAFTRSTGVSQKEAILAAIGDFGNTQAITLVAIDFFF